MNRGVMVTRGDPDVDELVLSAKGICSDKKNDPVKDRLEPVFVHLAKAYKAICEKQEREFFGLRDFYRCAGHSVLPLSSLINTTHPIMPV